MARRLPVYLLLDTSGSMCGEPIQSVNVGLQAMLSALRTDPQALDTVHLCVITFDAQVQVVAPLTPLDQVQLPEIRTPESGPTFLGRALELVCQCIDREVRKNTTDAKGDWMPLLFVMTDGSPSDLQVFREQVAEIKRRSFSKIIACAAGPKAKEAFLRELTDTVVSLDTMDSATFRQYFKWVSDTVSSGGRSVGAADGFALPPAPPEVQYVH